MYGQAFYKVIRRPGEGEGKHTRASPFGGSNENNGVSTQEGTI